MGNTGSTPARADFIVVANRLPADLERLKDGSERWKPSPGGLVAALEPFLRAREGAWIGWPGIADIDIEPFTGNDMHLRPVRLLSDDLRS